ncbi:MAG: exodeoxyribonuclease V subunit alpha [Glaciecola sp.]
MTLFSSLYNLPYATSNECCAALADIEPIDFFLAQQVVSDYCYAIQYSATSEQAVACTKTISANALSVLFHVVLALSYAQRNSSVCVHLSQLDNNTWFASQDSDNDIKKGYTFGDVGTTKDIILEAIFVLQNANNDCKQPVHIMLENDYLYTKRSYFYECYVCDFIQQRVNNQELERIIIEQKHAEYSQVMSDLFTQHAFDNGQLDAQQLALVNTICNRFSIITGGAGTGKTYTVTRLVVMLQCLFNIDSHGIALVAPTGKAANRLSESLHSELNKLSASARVPLVKKSCESLTTLSPKTLHRLLKIDPQTGTARFNQDQKLPHKVVLVDEASMVDISLMYKLMSSLHDDCTLILIGDANQLPSVESGSLLADLVNHRLADISKRRFSVLQQLLPSLCEAPNLSQLLTVRENSFSYVNKLFASMRSVDGILQFANAILTSNLEQALDAVDNQSVVLLQDNYWDNETAFIHLIDQVVWPHFKILSKCASVEQAFDHMTSYGLLTPFKHTPFGVQNINSLLETRVKQHLRYTASTTYYVGKPIMILQNDYQQGLYNGDIGIVWPNESGKLVVFFKHTNNQFKQVPIYSLPLNQANYAMTIHKTQGSEYESVHILLPPINQSFLTKELVYTAVTRAKKHVHIYTNEKTLSSAINYSIDRISGIDKRLN